MASIRAVKSSARKRVQVESKVLEMSITVGYLSGDVSSGELNLLHKLLIERCEAGLVSLERGETEHHLHFQMVYRAEATTTRCFGCVVRQYMKWNTQGHITGQRRVGKESIGDDNLIYFVRYVEIWKLLSKCSLGYSLSRERARWGLQNAEFGGGREGELGGGEGQSTVQHRDQQSFVKEVVEASGRFAWGLSSLVWKWLSFYERLLAACQRH